MNLRRFCSSLVLASTVLLCGVFTATANAQTPASPLTVAPLPANYQTILSNPDLLVMRVHYGPHEFVAMHDHTAYPTVYVYLNDSGELDIKHEGEDGFTAHRPPTHTGAFRLAPGMSERHSVTNLSDKPSDFLRVELKRIPPTGITKVVRGEAAASPSPGLHTDYENSALRVERIVCPPESACLLPPASARSLLVAVAPIAINSAEGKQPLQPGEVLWLPSASAPLRLGPGAQALRISLLYPE